MATKRVKSGPPKDPRAIKGRIRPALITAIRLIVEKGYTQRDAAQAVGMNEVSLSLALHKPHVIEARSAVKRAWLGSATDKAWLTVVTLAETAASEDVRLKAAKTLLDASGELGASKTPDGPRTLVQIVVNHAPATPQPIGHRLPGVIELQAVQGKRVDPSNSTPVGRP